MFKKIFVLIIALFLLLNATPFGFADEGVGQTQIHIHMKDEKIGENKDSITIVIDGQEYHGVISGSKIEIEMNTTENGFNFAKNESLDIDYYNNSDGTNGTITITYKEGNGNNIQNEHDKGLNNFNGVLKTDNTTIATEETEIPTDSSEDVITTEPPTENEPMQTEPPTENEPMQTEPPEEEETAPEDDSNVTVNPPEEDSKENYKTNDEYKESIVYAEVPKTGDISLGYLILSLGSGSCLFYMHKKDEE